MRDRVRDKVPDKVRDKLPDKQLSGKLSGGLSGRLSGGLSAQFGEVYAANPPSRENTSLRVVSEWFPSGFRVVSEWFPSGFRVVSEWFWRVPNLSEDLSGGLSRVLGPSKLSGRLSGVCPGGCRGFAGRAFEPSKLVEGCPGLFGELSRRFCALKAVRRVVQRTAFVNLLGQHLQPAQPSFLQTPMFQEGQFFVNLIRATLVEQAQPS